MFRTFSLALPADTAVHNLWDLLVAAGFCDSLGNELVSAVKNQAIIPDRVQELTYTVLTGTITVSDRQASGGDAYTSGLGYTHRSGRNSICLKDYFFTGAAGSETFTIEMESV